MNVIKYWMQKHDQWHCILAWLESLTTSETDDLEASSEYKSVEVDRQTHSHGARMASEDGNHECTDETVQFTLERHKNTLERCAHDS